MIDKTYVPSWSAVESLSGVVIALTVTTNEQKLVHGVGSLLVEGVDEAVEALPLGQGRGRRITLGRIGDIAESKVDSGLSMIG